MAETQTDPEEIVVLPLPSDDVPLAKISPPGTPSGQMEGLPNIYDQRMDPANSAIQQSGAITRSAKKTTGIAFSGGGIRSAAFCSGALRKMLQNDVPLEHLSCVSGGGYTGAAFLDWKRRPENAYDKKWHKEFFENMRENAGYMCNWRSPWWGIWDSFVCIVLLLFVVLILPCILWLPYSLPVAVAVDVLFGDILRENSTCPPSVKEGARTSFLIMELYDDCQPPARRVALFMTTFFASLLFFILSRVKQLVGYKGPLRLLSTLSGLVFVFSAFPWVAHDFLWPSRTWIKALIFIICLVLPFFFPIIRNYAGLFLGFYSYTYIVSWKVFKSELFGALPYSDDVFYPVLMGCAIACIAFPFIGSLHQSAFNVYYRYRLSKAFFKSRAECRCVDVFPCCVRSVDGISHFIRGKGFRGVSNGDDIDKELTLQDLEDLSPTFISNITVNDWTINSGAKSSHQLMSFSSEGIKLIGNDVENGETELPNFKGCFEPKHTRLSAAMAISGAAVSFDMGSYESGPLDMVLELLNLLGIGMGDEMVCDQHADTSTSRFRKYGAPILVEILCFLPLTALPFVYWLGHSKDWVEYLVLVHVVVVLMLTGFAFVKTGSTEPGKWERFIRWCITHVFFVRFIRGFLNINNVGTNPPPVLRLSDGGHFENLALLPLLDKKLEKIVIFDGSCNPGDDKYADSLLIALNLAREKLYCSFVGENGRDINEDIRVKFLKMKSQQRPRYYKFHVRYYDGEDNKQSEGEILFIAPRHPSESMPLKKIIDEEPKPWDVEHPSEGMPLKGSIEEQPRPWDAELGLDPKKWGESPQLTEREAERLTLCCCHCCHGSSHCISDVLIGRFPHHKTANQFFTPDTFSAYHREGYAACVEADVGEFLTKQSTQDS